MDNKIINLVLAGGGVKGVSLVGAISALEAAGYRINRAAGSSAGAIVAGLLMAGFTSAELTELLQNVSYKKFQDEGLLDRLGLPGKAASLIFEKGIYEGDFFCRWYDDLLGQKGVHVFDDIKVNGQYRFAAFAADITRGKLVRFPEDLPALGIDPGRQLIAEAVRASISIPFFYEPVKLAGNYLVDGGILSNFPIDAFQNDPLPTIGIKLSAQPGSIAKPHKITGPISYAEAVFSTTLSAQDQIHLNDPKVIAKTIFVDTGDVMATDFDLSKDQQQVLFEAGKLAAQKFLARQQASSTPSA